MRDRALPFKLVMDYHGVPLLRSGTGDENPASVYHKPFVRRCPGGYNNRSHALRR